MTLLGTHISHDLSEGHGAAYGAVVIGCHVGGSGGSGSGGGSGVGRVSRVSPGIQVGSPHHVHHGSQSERFQRGVFLLHEHVDPLLGIFQGDITLPC